MLARICTTGPRVSKPVTLRAAAADTAETAGKTKRTRDAADAAAGGRTASGRRVGILEEPLLGGRARLARGRRFRVHRVGRQGPRERPRLLVVGPRVPRDVLKLYWPGLRLRR
jgi:hypothetical protein